MPSGTESQVRNKRKILATQCVKRKLPLSDVSFAISGDLGVQLGDVASWPSRSISNIIQKLGGVEDEDSVVQILNDALGQCKKRITTVENKGGDAIRLI